jgi:hypothetical protein
MEKALEISLKPTLNAFVDGPTLNAFVDSDLTHSMANGEG